MKPTVLGIVVVLALLAAGAIFMAGNAFAPTEAPSIEQTYANDAYGISFAYPAGYVLAEENGSKGGEERYSIRIIREEDAVPRVNSEGPTAITIDIYGGAEPLSLEAWLLTPESNQALGDGTHEAASVDSKEAIRYRWSGLYEGETTAFEHDGRVIAVSVTYMSPADQIYEDYLVLLASMRLR